MPKTQAAILVDGSNLHYSCKQLGFVVDFKKILNQFDGTIKRAMYFTALPPREEQSTLKPLVDWMDYNGWTIVQKETKEFIDNGVSRIKGNMDVEMAVMALEIAPHVDQTILFTGDGDFAFLVDTLKRHYGHTVTVVSTIRSQPPMCADELRRACDEFIDLADIRQHIERTERPVRRGVQIMGS